MSDQQAIHDFDDLVAPYAGRGWVAVVSTANTDLAERYGSLLERADIPFLLEDTIQDVTSDAESAQTIAVHVPESCFDRACEVVARDHAETTDGPDDEDDILEDDGDLDDDLDDDDGGDSVPDDGDDDHFDDDSDDHNGGEPADP